jgi:hypothetical protein
MMYINKSSGPLEAASRPAYRYAADCAILLDGMNLLGCLSQKGHRGSESLEAYRHCKSCTVGLFIHMYFSIHMQSVECGRSLFHSGMYGLGRLYFFCNSEKFPPHFPGHMRLQPCVARTRPYVILWVRSVFDSCLISVQLFACIT